MALRTLPVTDWPASEDEWRAFAQSAAGLLLIDDMRRQGMLRGGPYIDRAGCEELLARAAELGIEPPNDVSARAVALARAFNGEEVDLGDD